jgi:hypothetical protein
VLLCLKQHIQLTYINYRVQKISELLLPRAVLVLLVDQYCHFTT